MIICLNVQLRVQRGVVEIESSCSTVNPVNEYGVEVLYSCGKV
jgi:hypothetical protein